MKCWFDGMITKETEKRPEGKFKPYILKTLL